MTITNDQIDGWIYDPSVDPDPRFAELMAIIDAMPLGFRLLVHDYGVNPVIALINAGVTCAKGARRLLETRREQRQEQWLRTNYIEPRNEASRLRGLAAERWHDKQMFMHAMKRAA